MSNRQESTEVFNPELFYNKPNLMYNVNDMRYVKSTRGSNLYYEDSEIKGPLKAYNSKARKIKRTLLSLRGNTLNNLTPELTKFAKAKVVKVVEISLEAELERAEKFPKDTNKYWDLTPLSKTPPEKMKFMYFNAHERRISNIKDNSSDDGDVIEILKDVGGTRIWIPEIRLTAKSATMMLKLIKKGNKYYFRDYIEALDYYIDQQ